MKRFILAVAAVPLACVRPGQVLADEIWDVTNDFSVSNGNPNGSWSYGWANGSGQFLLDGTGDVYNGSRSWWGIYDTGPVVWVNNLSYTQYEVQPGQVSLQPGENGEACVVRWTAPAAFTSPTQVQITGQFLAGDSGAPYVGIVIDGIPLRTTPYWQATDFGSFSFPYAVSAGDTIDFAVWGADYGANTPLEATITAVPEPAALMLLAAAVLGLGGVAYVRRRRAANA